MVNILLVIGWVGFKGGCYRGIFGGIWDGQEWYGLKELVGVDDLGVGIVICVVDWYGDWIGCIVGVDLGIVGGFYCLDCWLGILVVWLVGYDCCVQLLFGVW